MSGSIDYAQPRTTTTVEIRPGMTTAELVKTIIKAAAHNGRPVKLGFLAGGVDADGEQWMRLYFERIKE